ncbi:SDR family NAD(P)-dependent oxidoreductase [Kitasatospora sp. NPDC056446]|uniref:type I polyketide synthase n=1 Tax=Kitasatospora sp. NPDC056446 TaxID=3345819 RepID=UPI00368D84D6
MNRVADDDRIAVIGMACRLPGAPDVESYWSNLLTGTVSLTELSDDTLRNAGVAESAIADPHHVKRAPLLDDVAGFDARLFGFTPREAELRDPQQRIFLEVAYGALEDAGVRTDGPTSVGVFAGGATNRYAELNVRRNAAAVRNYGEVGIQAGNHNDYIATIVSYKLDLRGPAFTVATACSTSLVALHLACQALRNGECDVAVAGGVQLELPHGAGHRWVDGGIFSRDGRCRPFDAAADGTIFGDGAGAVVLKPLADALRDGDRVLATIRGSAVNNDGNRKAGFAAPSAEGQFAAVYEALAVSGVAAEQVGYLEAHGTGTAIGDPIEVQALSRAYRAHTDRTGYCLLSSAKGNIGHLGPASGIAGFIKAVLAVNRGIAPGTANFTEANPLMELASTPFTVRSQAGSWPIEGPRIAGVSSFGIGGTNAHVLVEQPPAETAGGPSPARRRTAVLPLAAASAPSLRGMAEKLSAHLAEEDTDLHRAARTLQRRPLRHRHRIAVVGEDAATLSDALADLAARGGNPGTPATGAVFLFPGQGTQHPAMAAELYAHEPVFRAELDRCLEHFGATVADALRAALLRDAPDAADRLRDTALTQPALFAVEWALARLWASWGVRPVAMIGHSVGEITAAALAGVFELADAARLVVRRGELLAAAPAGRMVALAMPAAEAAPLLEGRDVWLSADNGERSCTVGGPVEAVEELTAVLTALGRRWVALDVERAFHTPATERAAEELAAFVGELTLKQPSVRWVSNVTGDWITDRQATDPQYWADHLRSPVRFREGAARAAEVEGAVLLEVGPGQALTQLVRRVRTAAGHRPLASLPPAGDDTSATTVLYRAVAALWQAGLDVDWRALLEHEQLTPVPLPGYAFDRERYWISPDPQTAAQAPAARPQAAQEPRPAAEDDRITVPGWTSARPAEAEPVPAGRRWLVLADDAGQAAPLLDRLAAAGIAADLVKADDVEPKRLGAALLPHLRDHHEPLEIVHLWLTGPGPDGAGAGRTARHWLDRGFRATQRIVQDLTRHCPDRPVRITVLADRLWDVSGSEPVEPAKSPVAALLHSAVREHEHLRARVVDAPADALSGTDRTTAEALWALLGGDDGDDFTRIALRGRRHWHPAFHSVPEPAVPSAPGALADAVDGTWLITGGFGALGLVAAERLAARGATGIALLGRSGLPERGRWDDPALGEGPRAAVEAVRRMESAGCRVLPLAADVADRASLTGAVQRVRADLGPIRGVIHAAGLAGGGMLAVKDAAVAEQVLRPKVNGTLLLDEILGDEPRTFVLYSSVAAVTGQFGLSDYGAANAFLDAFAHERSRRRPGRTLSVNWPSWDGAGMAVEAAAKHSRFHAERPNREPELVAAPAGGAGHAFTVRLAPDVWMVDEHRMGETPVLPGTGYLELVLRAVRTFHTGPVRLADVAFTAPLAIAGPLDLTITFEPDRSGWRFRVESRAEGARAAVQHAGGSVTPYEDTAPRHDLAALRAAHTVPLAGPRLNDGSGLMTVGARWHTVERVSGGTDSVLAELALPAAHRGDAAANLLHPALLDCATSFLLPLPEGVNALPFSYRAVVVRGPLPARVTALVRPWPEQPKGAVVRDISLIDEAGREVVTISGFTLLHVDRATVAGNVRPGGDAERTAPLRSSGAVQDSFLGVEAGAALLEALLATDLGPQVVVAPEGLREKLRRTGRFTAASVRSSGTGAGAVGTAGEPTGGTAAGAAAGTATPPRAEGRAGGGIADRIGGLWTEILGTEAGPDDDFFESGGDSLAAVQLVDRIRGELAVELPISALFDHPTLSELVAAVGSKG